MDQVYLPCLLENTASLQQLNLLIWFRKPVNQQVLFSSCTSLPPLETSALFLEGWLLTLPSSPGRQCAAVPATRELVLEQGFRLITLANTELLLHWMTVAFLSSGLTQGTSSSLTIRWFSTWCLHICWLVFISRLQLWRCMIYIIRHLTRHRCQGPPAPS